jgi:hypothetical protein
MKTLNNIIRILTCGIVLSILGTSCLPKEELMGDAGQTLVRLNPLSFTLTVLNPESTPQTMPMFEVRRDIAGPAALNKTTTVILQFDSDTVLLDKYNTDKGTTFIPLPVTLHSTTPELSNGKLTVNFAPGEFAKTISITVPNAFNFDFSKKYALTYTLTDVSGEGSKSLAKDSVIIVQIMAKNKYDGIYTVTANSPMADLVNPAFTGFYPFIYMLVTTGEHTCDIIEFDNNAPIHPITSATGTWSYYGGFCPKLTFSASGDGTISAVTNYYGPDATANKRNCVINPSGINKWDAATKTIKLKYILIQKANTALTDPWYRTYFDEVWTYSGPR